MMFLLSNMVPVGTPFIEDGTMFMVVVRLGNAVGVAAKIGDLRVPLKVP